jgi:hypothetical protein
MALDYWTVSPGGANGVITASGVEAEQFAGLETSLHGAVEDIVGDCKSSLIAAALQDVYDNYIGPVAKTTGLTAINVVNEGTKIVQAWIDGDETMAAAARREIAQVPSSEADAQ